MAGIPVRILHKITDSYSKKQICAHKKSLTEFINHNISRNIHHSDAMIRESTNLQISHL